MTDAMILIGLFLAIPAAAFAWDAATQHGDYHLPIRAGLISALSWGGGVVYAATLIAEWLGR